jgi:hypothetical protein
LTRLSLNLIRMEMDALKLLIWKEFTTAINIQKSLAEKWLRMKFSFSSYKTLEIETEMERSQKMSGTNITLLCHHQSTTTNISFNSWRLLGN